MEESNRNVLSWHQALDKGFNPSSYPFETALYYLATIKNGISSTELIRKLALR